MSELIDTTEMYLRTIFELEEEGIVPLRARIAERLGHSGPTVSQTVARMERDGLLRVTGDRHLELTAEGRAKATRVMRKHRLAERLLLDVIGLEWELVHDEACRWEHVMSDQVERKLVRLLPDLSQSPYGNPIPGLAEVSGTEADGPGVDGAGAGGSASGPASTAAPELVAPSAVGLHALPEALDGIGSGQIGDEEVRFVLRRLGETVQTDVGLLGNLARAGLRPGSAIAARRTKDTFHVSGAAGELELPREVASHLFVAIAEVG